MISNPGSAPATGLMEKAIYDTSNKNTDIFNYVDGKISTEASSRSSGDTSTLNSSKSYTDTKFDELNSPYLWRTVDIIKPSYTATILKYNSSGIVTEIDGNSRDFWYVVQLPYPMYLKTYAYEFFLFVEGWGYRSPSGGSNSFRIYFHSASDITNHTSGGDRYIELFPPQSAKYQATTVDFHYPAVVHCIANQVGSPYVLKYQEGWWLNSGTNATVTYHSPDSGARNSVTDYSKVSSTVTQLGLNIDTAYSGNTAPTTVYTFSTFGVQLHYRALKP